MTSAPPRLPGSSPAALATRLVASLAVGWLLYQASCWLVPPDPTMIGGFEQDWQAMSRDPFAFPGRLPHRILAPLLAWLSGWGGEGWHDFTEGLHVVLLASVCFVAQHLGARLFDAVLITALVAFTAPVQMYKLHWNGYTDPICYALFLWAFVASRNPYVFWALFLVNLTNHELAGFLVPWLWFLRRREDDRWRLDLVLFAAACGVYLAYYLAVKANVDQQFSIDYFVGHPLFPGGTFVVWNLTVVHWVCTFGPMLALVAWHQHARPPLGERWHLWVVLLGVLVIFCIAFDWARHSNLILLPLVVAAVRFLAGGVRARAVFVGLLAATLLLFWLVPPWSSNAWPTSVLLDGTPQWREEHNPEGDPMKVFLVETGLLIPEVGPQGQLNIGFGPLSAALDNWLPEVWGALLILHGIGAAIWLLGFALSRLRKLRAPA